MKKINEYKEKFYFYWRQRKYKLSIFGVNPNFDWLVFLLIAIIMLTGSGFWGFWNYKKINQELNKEIILEDKEKDQVDLESISVFISDFGNRSLKFKDLIGEDLPDSGDVKGADQDS